MKGLDLTFTHHTHGYYLQADFRVSVNAFTAADEDLSCLKAHVDFRKHHRFDHISHLFGNQEENTYIFDL